MGNDRYQEIRKALEMGPTPGPRKWWEHEDFGYCWVNPRDGGLWIAKCDVRDPFDQEQRANAALIAACDPDTIRALLDERDALAAEAEALRKDAERWRKAREILPVEAIKIAHSDFVNFGLPPDEKENVRVDDAIDATMAAKEGE